MRADLKVRVNCCSRCAEVRAPPSAPKTDLRASTPAHHHLYRGAGVVRTDRFGLRGATLRQQVRCTEGARVRDGCGSSMKQRREVRNG